MHFHSGRCARWWPKSDRREISAQRSRRRRPESDGWCIRCRFVPSIPQYNEIGGGQTKRDVAATSEPYDSDRFLGVVRRYATTTIVATRCTADVDAVSGGMRAQNGGKRCAAGLFRQILERVSNNLQLTKNVIIHCRNLMYAEYFVDYQHKSEKWSSICRKIVVIFRETRSVRSWHSNYLSVTYKDEWMPEHETSGRKVLRLLVVLRLIVAFLSRLVRPDWPVVQHAFRCRTDRDRKWIWEIFAFILIHYY